MKRMRGYSHEMLNFEGTNEPKIQEAGLSSMIPLLVIAGLVSTVLVVAVKGASAN